MISLWEILVPIDDNNESNGTIEHYIKSNTDFCCTTKPMNEIWTTPEIKFMPIRFKANFLKAEQIVKFAKQCCKTDVMCYKLSDDLIKA